MSDDPSRWEQERAALFARKDALMAEIHALLDRTRNADELAVFELVEARRQLEAKLEEVDQVLLTLSASRLRQEREENEL